MSVPFIFFAFANSTKEYLPNLKKETQGVLEIMLRLREDLGLVAYDHRGEITTDQVYDIVTKVGEKLSILHFSGHADSLNVQLEDGEYKIDNFAKLIGGLQNLQLVFLNGCSSKGMVEYLLDAGVKAVIATSEEIDDYQASQFSIAFYQAFSVKGKSLKMAFNQALSQLKHPPSEADSIIPRATFKRKTAGKPNKSIPPWALYYRESEQTVLDWVLVKINAESATNHISNPEIEELRKEINALHENIRDLEGDIENLDIVIEALGGENGDHPKLPEKLDSKNKKQAAIQQLEEEIEEKYQDIITANRGQEELYLGDTLRTALDRLNYGRQLKSFREIYSQKSGALRAAFIVQGSPQCGQEMLKERLINLAGIRNEFREIKVDFEALSAEAAGTDNIWSRFKTELEKSINKSFPPESTMEPLDLVKEVYQNFFDKKHPQHLILLFNNVHTFTEKLNLQIVQEFWFKFSDLLDQLLEGKTLPANLLLFIIDRDCKVNFNGDIPISDKEAGFKKAFKDQDLKTYNTHLFPIIEPLKASELDQWNDAQQIPLDLGLNSAAFADITCGDKGNFVLPSIKKICELTGYKKIYQKYYLVYEFEIPEL